LDNRPDERRAAMDTARRAVSFRPAPDAAVNDHHAIGRAPAVAREQPDDDEEKRQDENRNQPYDALPLYL